MSPSVLYYLKPTSQHLEYRRSLSVQKCPSSVYFLKQTIQNACGTVGLLHSVGNNLDQISLDGPLKKFFSATKNMTPLERGKYLESDVSLSDAHSNSALQGQTETPSIDEDIDLHFTCFVVKSGMLYELDGTTDAPICCGSCEPEQLLENAAKKISEFCAREPNQLNFNVIALSRVSS
eukprot:Sdes_comp18910_c0_seq1m9360